jgi:hypothetical protein
MPVDLTKRRGAAAIAYTLVDQFPGTRNTALDDAASLVRFELHFPGNLSGLVRKLADNAIAVGESATVTLPVQSLAPELIAAGAGVVGERLEEGTEVWDVAFDRGHYVLDASMAGDHIEATIVPSTLAMHQIYDGLLSLGLVASDPVAVAAG